MNATPFRLAAALIACALAGCSTTKTTPDSTEAPEARTERSDRVTSMGSWIPRKKTKAQMIGDGTRVVEGSALEKVQAAGAANVPRDPSR